MDDLPSTRSQIDPAERIGQQVGRYTLVEKIGEGGMGEVWVARQSEPVKRKVALKLIKTGMDSRAVIARFEQERQALAVMDHPNIAKVHDGGLAENGRPYFVMELVAGAPLTKYCDDAKLAIRERLELFIPVCQAVQHAHSKGVVHRDLKPANVLVAVVDGKPVPKVIDFGVAKAMSGKLTEETFSTQFGAVLGTLEYMAPEQAGLSLADVDTRADVYSLGVILYELLTGLRPFDSSRLRSAALDEMIRIIREEDPPSLTSRLSTDESLPSVAAVRGVEPARLLSLVKGELDWIVQRCLEKDRDRRYETASNLARDVERYLADEPIEARPVHAGYRLKKFLRRHRGPVLAAGLLFLALLAGVVGTTWGFLEARRSATAEARAKDEAIKRLSQIEKGNEILLAVFRDLDVRAARTANEPTEALLARRLVKAAEQLEGEAVGDPLAVARLQDQLGVSLISLGHADAALKFLHKAWETRRAAQGADHRETLESLNNLAACLLALGDFNKALPLLEEALERKKATLGPDDGDTLTAMNNLASAYQRAGQFDRAIPMYDAAVKRLKVIKGSDDRATLAAMNNLATAHRGYGDLKSALPVLEEALERSTAKYGRDHPDTLMVMGNLASMYQDANRREPSLRLWEESWRLRKAKLGSDHPDAISSMNGVAEGYRIAGRVAEAIPLYEEGIKLSTARSGRNNSGTMVLMNNLAAAYYAAGKVELALPLLENILEYYRTREGPDHPNTLASMNSLAAARQLAGRLAEALPLFETAALGFERRGFKDRNATVMVANTAAAYEAAGQLDKAERWRRKWLAVLKERSGVESAAYAAELALLGDNLLRQKKFADAETVLRECLAIREKTQPQLWTTFNTQSALGGALADQMKYADAEPLLLKGFAGLKAREASIPPTIKSDRFAAAADRLVALYTALNKPAEVKKWQAERARHPSIPSAPTKAPPKAN